MVGSEVPGHRGMKKRVWLKCGRPWQCPSHSPSFNPKLRAPLKANSFLPLLGEGILGLWERARAACGQHDSEGTHTLEQTRFPPRFLYFKWDHCEPWSTWHVWGCAAGPQVPTAVSCSPIQLHWFPPCLFWRDTNKNTPKLQLWTSFSRQQ